MSREQVSFVTEFKRLVNEVYAILFLPISFPLNFQTRESAFTEKQSSTYC